MVIRRRGLARTGILAAVGLALAAQPAPGIAPTLTPCVVSPEWADSAGYDLFAEWDSSGGPCPAGDYAVRTYQLPRAADGSIVVGDPTASDTVAFVLIVP